MVKHLLSMQETQVQSLDCKDPQEKEMATHSSTLFFFFFRYTVLLTFKTNVMIIEIIIGRAFNK